jgi:hypothetical protein
MRHARSRGYPIGLKATYQQRTAADRALMEAWQRLLSAGLIMQAPGQPARVMTLTAKGREAADSVSFEDHSTPDIAPRGASQRSARPVYENFASGNYDTAVRDAFVQV